MTKLILDGERSRLRLGLAKSLLRRIQAAGIPVKTIEVDGFRISVRVDPPTIKIVAPPLAVVVICTQANHARWFMSEGLGSALVGHDLTHCVAVDAGGDCTDTRLVDTTLISYVGPACLPCSVTPWIGEILELTCAYYQSATGSGSFVFYVPSIPTLCFGLIQRNGVDLPPQVLPLPMQETVWSLVHTRNGFVCVSDSTDRSVTAASSEIFSYIGTHDVSRATPGVQFEIKSDLFFSLFFNNQVATLPQASAVWRATVFLIEENAAYVRVGVMLWVLEYVTGAPHETPPYISMTQVTFTIPVGGGAVQATQVWYAQRQPDMSWSFDATIIGGSPVASVFNRIQFVDTDGVCVLWGLWVDAYTNPAADSLGHVRLDHLPPTMVGAPQIRSYRVEFVQNGLGAYIFPPLFFAPLIRPNFVSFMRNGQPVWFLIFQQFAAPTGLDNYVREAYIGTPWAGWTPFVLPTTGVVRDVRLLQYAIEDGDLVLGALALVETVDAATGGRAAHVEHLDTTVSAEWQLVGSLSADQVPSDPALWRVAMYGEGVGRYRHPDGEIPDMPQVASIL